MSSGIHDVAHPVTAFVAGLHSALDRLTGTPAWSMQPTELAGALVELHRERARLAELELRLVAQASSDGLGCEVGAADTKAWWANTTRQNRSDVHRRLALATALGRRKVLHAGLVAGDVAEDQASVISRALEALPDDVDAGVVDQAEAELVRLAGIHDAKDLIQLGKSILHVVAPEVGEAQLRAALEREEAEAAKACRFTMSDDGHGKSHGRFTVPTGDGAMLLKALRAFLAPKHQAAVSGAAQPGEPSVLDRPGPERMGRAFCEFIRRYPTDHLPNAGGVSATVNVTMTFADFTGESDAPAHFDTGELVTASEARRLACEAGIVPVVLGGRSQPLDVGRKRRFHTATQRAAIALRDKTCTALGCDAPPGMCHVHHDDPWSLGGPTNVVKGRLLCPRHRTMAHQKKYTMKATKNGRVIFSRT